MTKKREELYEEDKLKEAGVEMVAMADRFGVRKEDVVFAVWKMGKDMVCAQLERDLRYKHLREKGRGGETER